MHPTQSSPAKFAGLMTRIHDTIMTVFSYFTIVTIVLFMLFMTKDPMKGE